MHLPDMRFVLNARDEPRVVFNYRLPGALDRVQTDVSARCQIFLPTCSNYLLFCRPSHGLSEFTRQRPLISFGNRDVSSPMTRPGSLPLPTMRQHVSSHSGNTLTVLLKLRGSHSEQCKLRLYDRSVPNPVPIANVALLR